MISLYTSSWLVRIVYCREAIVFVFGITQADQDMEKKNLLDPFLGIEIQFYKPYQRKIQYSHMRNFKQLNAEAS